VCNIVIPEVTELTPNISLYDESFDGGTGGGVNREEPLLLQCPCPVLRSQCSQLYVFQKFSLNPSSFNPLLLPHNSQPFSGF
jgi:hypothetical protein